MKGWKIRENEVFFFLFHFKFRTTTKTRNQRNKPELFFTIESILFVNRIVDLWSSLDYIEFGSLLGVDKYWMRETLGIEYTVSSYNCSGVRIWVHTKFVKSLGKIMCSCSSEYEFSFYRETALTSVYTYIKSMLLDIDGDFTNFEYQSRVYRERPYIYITVIRSPDAWKLRLITVHLIRNRFPELHPQVLYTD